MKNVIVNNCVLKVYDVNKFPLCSQLNKHKTKSRVEPLREFEFWKLSWVSSLLLCDCNVTTWHDFHTPPTFRGLPYATLLRKLFPSVPIPLTLLACFFIAESVMRLHRKIFHDIKNPFVRTILLFLDSKPSTEHTQKVKQRQETKRKNKKSFVQLNQSEINFLLQPFLSRVRAEQVSQQIFL